MAKNGTGPLSKKNAQVVVSGVKKDNDGKHYVTLGSVGDSNNSSLGGNK